MANPEIDNYVAKDYGKIITYEHHGTIVSVRKNLKGLHRDHCLCYNCAKFKPGMPEENCPIANLIYAVCIAHDVTTPVWECKQFILGEHYFSTKITPKLADISSDVPIPADRVEERDGLIQKKKDKPLVEHKSTCAIYNNPPRGFSSEVTQCDCGTIVRCADNKHPKECNCEECTPEFQGQGG